jgi:prepilin-type N-terminal cleavage/methylation domain-containing protein
MADNKGFTLIEIIVVLVIVGLLSAIAIPNFNASIERTKAQSNENNLLAISAAQQKFFEDYGAYCTGQNINGNLCGNNVTDLNTNLHLGLSSNDKFTYICSDAAPYTCVATDGTDTLTLTYTAAQGAVLTCASVVNAGYCPS